MESNQKTTKLKLGKVVISELDQAQIQGGILWTLIWCGGGGSLNTGVSCECGRTYGPQTCGDECDPNKDTEQPGCVSNTGCDISCNGC